MNPAKYPSLVMVIRHGEKPGDPSNDDDGGPSLSALGSARAAALPSLFTPDPTATPVGSLQQLTCDLTVGTASQFSGEYSSSQISAGQSRFQTPKFLFATQQKSASKKHPSGGSNRPVETITPLGQALSFFENQTITINDNFADDGEGIQGLTSEILNNPGTYGGQVVLICWHHGSIAELVQSFGVPANQFPNWPSSTVFDLVLCITWVADQAQLIVNYQQLLYGDTTQSTSPGGPANP
jgi:hypothetical protein